MDQSFKITGGARIGWLNATWPLAQLSITRDRLTIKVGLLGTYSFSSAQVISVERYVRIPVLGWGIQIRHAVAEYPERVIFWCLGNPDTILSKISATGFVPTASISSVRPRGAMPVRWSAVIATVAIWNILFWLDSLRSRGNPQVGIFTCVGLLLVFCLSVGTLKSPKIQNLILKNGRSVIEIKPILRLLAFISGVMLISCSMIYAFGGFNY